MIKNKKIEEFEIQERKVVVCPSGPAWTFDKGWGRLFRHPVPGFVLHLITNLREIKRR